MPTFEQAFNDIEDASASTLKSVAELSKAVETVQSYEPLEGDDLTEAMEDGKRRAAALGEHRGPVV